MKKTRGFSYIEVIFALALFAIAMLAVIPAITQAARNMAFAREAYAGHLQAQRLLLVVQDAVIRGDCPTAAAINFAAGDFEFSFKVIGNNTQYYHTMGAPDIGILISGKSPAIAGLTTTIIIVVWGEDGQVLGRAVGMLHS